MKAKSALAPLLVSLPLLGASLASGQDRQSLDLSLDEAVKRALENNADIAVDKYNPQAAAFGLTSSLGVYDPLATGLFRWQKSTTQPTNVFSGNPPGTNGVTNDIVTWNAAAAQYLPSGGSFNLAFNNNRISTNQIFATINPVFNSSFTGSLTQPLLRNFQWDLNRLNIKVAKKNKEISDVNFRQTVITTIAGVKELYYELIYAHDNLEAARKSLNLAKKLLDENQIKVRVGTMAPLDVVQAESEVASREGDVIVAEAALENADDNLKKAIFPKNDPVTWDLRLNPTDRPTAELVPVDMGGAIKTALEKRTDVVAARMALENTEYQAHYAKNQVLPQVDFVASYSLAGAGGTVINRGPAPDPRTPGPVLSIVPGGYGDALTHVKGFDFPTWFVGVNVSYPIQNRSAGASSARAQIALEQAQVGLRRLEMSVTAEVRSAARAVESNMKRVDSSRAARVLQERRLDAEEKKFAAGMSTNFFVTQAQRDLAVAEVAELRALADYRESLVNFERSQEAGLGGTGTTIAISTAVRPLTATSTTPSSTSTGSTGSPVVTSSTSTTTSPSP